MIATHSLEAQARIAILRQRLRSMPIEQLRAEADHLLVTAFNNELMLRAAICRLEEIAVEQTQISQ